MDRRVVCKQKSVAFLHATLVSTGADDSFLLANSAKNLLSTKRITTPTTCQEDIPTVRRRNF